MGTISCNTQDNLKQLEDHQEILGKIIEKNENRRKNVSPELPELNISKTKLFSNEVYDDKIKKLYVPKKRYCSNEKSRNEYDNKICNIISKNYHHTNITVKNNKLEENDLAEFSLKHQKSEKMINKIKYNNIYTNNYNFNDLNEEELIIVNNDELDESFQLYSKGINKEKYTTIKEKLIKAEEEFIKIKKEFELKIPKRHTLAILKSSSRVLLIKNRNQNIINNEVNDNIKEKTISHSFDKNVIDKEFYNKSDYYKIIMDLNKENIINSEINNINDNIEKDKINESSELNINNITFNQNEKNFFEKKLKCFNNYHNSNLMNKNTSCNDASEDIEIDDILTNILKIRNNSRNKEKIKNDYLTTTNTGSKVKTNKDYENQIYEFNTYNKSNEKEKNEKITNIYNIQPKRLTYPVYKKKKVKQKKCETLNKFSKNNIPKYRFVKSSSKLKNYHSFILKPSTLENDIKKFDSKLKGESLDNIINNNLFSSFVKSKNKKKKKIYSFTKRSYSQNNYKNDKDKNKKYSFQQMYLCHSSMIKSYNDELNLKNIKNKRLFKFIQNNIINKKLYNSYENSLNKSEKEKYKDTINIDISSININESLIDKDLLNTKVKNKIILNYNKLDNLSTSQILYEGIIYKFFDNKNKGFKISQKYFQITKNCFRYYHNIENAKINSDKPLVQFDIRHIKELNIINNDIFNQYKINNKEIKFSFCIFLSQNNDFFVFVVNDDKIGYSIFNILNLLKNYFEKKYD